METLANDFASIGNQQECIRRMFFYVVSEADCLHAVHYGEDNVFVLAAERALCLDNGCASVHLVFDEVANRLRIFADHIKIL